jgi:CRISPR-associated exonuclease Cas4
MNGIKGATGILEYPKLRKKEEVFLSDIDREQVADIEKEIEHIVESNDCPAVIHSKYCKKCSYYDFCYIQDAGN